MVPAPLLKVPLLVKVPLMVFVIAAEVNVPLFIKLTRVTPTFVRYVFPELIVTVAPAPLTVHAVPLVMLVCIIK